MLLFSTQKGAVALEYVQLDQRVADKPPTKGKFEMFEERLRLVENTFLAKGEC
jgi:hypothetical protein